MSWIVSRSFVAAIGGSPTDRPPQHPSRATARALEVWPVVLQAPGPSVPENAANSASKPEVPAQRMPPSLGTPIGATATPQRAMRTAYAAGMVVSRGSKARAARRRKRRMAGVEHDLTDEQWTALRTVWGGCAYCGASDKPLQRDCILPVSRGGRYTLDNVVPACPSCNTSKCNEKSPAGSGESGSTSGPSCCVTSKSGMHSGFPLVNYLPVAPRARA
jgi:5-methylcytosine-specific restriction endonuclease McrA